MSIFQVVSVLFALFMMYTVRIHHKKKTLSPSEASIWYSVWLLFSIIAVFPNFVSGIASSLRFTRVFDFLIVIAFGILSVITFNNYYAEKKLQDRLEQLVRSNSIKKATKENNDGTS